MQIYNVGMDFLRHSKDVRMGIHARVYHPAAPYPRIIFIKTLLDQDVALVEDILYLLSSYNLVPGPAGLGYFDVISNLSFNSHLAISR